MKESTIIPVSRPMSLINFYFYAGGCTRLPKEIHIEQVTYEPIIGHRVHHSCPTKTYEAEVEYITVNKVFRVKDFTQMVEEAPTEGPVAISIWALHDEGPGNYHILNERGQMYLEHFAGKEEVFAAAKEVVADIRDEIEERLAKPFG